MTKSVFTLIFISLPFRLPQGAQEIQQRKMLYMGLYLLIWGEAANIRFIPECLCYIFHNVSSGDLFMWTPPTVSTNFFSLVKMYFVYK